MKKKSVIIISIATIVSIVLITVLTIIFAVYIPKYKAEKQKAEAFANYCIDGLNHRNQGLLALAESELKNALEIDSTSWYAHYILGLCYYDDKSYYSAMSHLDQAYKLNTDKSDFCLNDICSASTHKLDDADTLRFVHLLHWAAWCSSYIRSYDKGIVYAQEEYYLDPNSEASDALSVLYAKKGEYSQALKWAEKMTGKVGEKRYNFRIGWIYDMMGNDKKAIEYYEKDILARPSKGAYRNLGLIYLRLGEYSKANEYMRSAAEMGSKEAQDYLLKKGLSW